MATPTMAHSPDRRCRRPLWRTTSYSEKASLTRTLANKMKISGSHVYHRYGDIIVYEHGMYRSLRVTAPPAEKTPLTAY